MKKNGRDCGGHLELNGVNSRWGFLLGQPFQPEAFLLFLLNPLIVKFLKFLEFFEFLFYFP
jgi:hypothetical protein